MSSTFTYHSIRAIEGHFVYQHAVHVVYDSMLSMCILASDGGALLTVVILTPLQAKSLGHGIRGTLYLINPVSLFKYSAISRIDRKGILCIL